MIKLKDSDFSDFAASENVTEDNVIDLYTDGHTSVPIPEGVDIDDYQVSVVDFIKSIWGEPDVNFDYGDAEFDTEVCGDVLNISVV